MSASPFPASIRALLADDEPVASGRLRKALEAYPQVKVIAEVTDGHAAISHINRDKPDLVFLDIQMPGYNGFEVLQHLEYTPLVIFVTAYDQYAIKAFEVNSVDYLLKPVAPDRLAISMQRVLEKGAQANLLVNVKSVLAQLIPEQKISTIPVKAGARVHFIQVEDVYFFEAKDKYVQVHTATGVHLAEHTLIYLEGRLPAHFIRVHRSFIVNKFKIREMQKYFKGTYLLVMADALQTRIRTAYSYAAAIREKLLLP
ncbi:LytR/AlgR family response regulator transcription factor [Chitinophaga parva]|nr:LytTR family DNA-binding domain-containing protein [Chitinophaga parva]